MRRLQAWLPLFSRGARSSAWASSRPVPAIRGQEGSALFGSALNRRVDSLFAKLAEDGAVTPAQFIQILYACRIVKEQDWRVPEIMDELYKRGVGNMLRVNSVWGVRKQPLNDMDLETVRTFCGFFAFLARKGEERNHIGPARHARLSVSYDSLEAQTARLKRQNRKVRKEGLVDLHWNVRSRPIRPFVPEKGL
jgi:hypothetical protein